MALRDTVVFRCDGGRRIGAGHLARCLPIAEAFRLRGAPVMFVGEYDGVARALLDAAGFASQPPVAGQLLELPDGFRAAILDRYGIPDRDLKVAAARWPLIAFRDVKRRDADSVPVLDYHLDAGPTYLAGPDYAPVSPRFVSARHGGDGSSALVTLGGSDAGNRLLPAIVTALAETHAEVLVVGPPADVQLQGTVVGARADMPRLFAQLGTVVCGAGFTAYEAACAGKPALLAVLAENQVRVGRAFGDLTPVIEGRRDVSAEALRASLRETSTSSLPSRGPGLVDGYGSFRVRDALEALIAGRPASTPLRYRPAAQDDAPLLLSWRNAPDVRRASRNSAVIEAGAHDGWLRRVLADERRTLLVVERAGVPIASIRFDTPDRRSASVSVVVAPGVRGEGLGGRVIRESTELQLAAAPQLERVRAEVRTENTASAAAFGKAGYASAGGAEGFSYFEALKYASAPGNAP